MCGRRRSLAHDLLPRLPLGPDQAPTPSKAVLTTDTKGMPLLCMLSQKASTLVAYSLPIHSPNKVATVHTFHTPAGPPNGNRPPSSFR